MPLPTIRRAKPADMPAAGRLAARLVRFHHAIDPRRFLCVEPIEPGYERWLTREIQNPEVVVVVAEELTSAGIPTVIGYAYGRLEPRDWNALLEAHGALHDVYVAEEARARGTGEALVLAVADHLRQLGAARVVLHTATQNVTAQRLFEKLGFRPTMVEMTRELD